MNTFNIELPSVINLMTGDNHKVAAIDTGKLTDAFVADAFVRSLRIAAMNTYNGGGKDATSVEKQAKLDKRLASWYRGEWAITERGEGIMTAFRDEVFLVRCVESGMTIKAAESLIRAKVKEHFPPETKATFANYIAACAIESKGDFDGDVTAATEAIESWYEAELDTRRKARDKVSAKLVAPAMDLSAFKKAPKAK